MAGLDYRGATEKRPRRGFSAIDAVEYLSYEKESGVFVWNHPTKGYGGVRPAGQAAGTIKDGYVQISIFGHQYRAHHLAWLFMTGDWPPDGMDIDHINCDRSDNSWSNLRLATRSQNNINTTRVSTAASGHRGVYRSRDGRKWFARINFDGKPINLGTFDQLESAIGARKAAEKQYFGEFA